MYGYRLCIVRIGSGRAACVGRELEPFPLDELGAGLEDPVSLLVRDELIKFWLTTPADVESVRPLGCAFAYSGR